MGVKFDQEAFDEYTVKEGILGFFPKPKILASKRESHWYVNWRNPIEDVYWSNFLAGQVIGFVQSLGLEPDCFYGVPEGATKTGLITQNVWAQMQPSYGPGSHVLPMG